MTSKAKVLVIDKESFFWEFDLKANGNWKKFYQWDGFNMDFTALQGAASASIIVPNTIFQKDKNEFPGKGNQEVINTDKVRPRVKITAANKLMFTGIVDNVKWHLLPSNEDKISINCRDLFGLLIDTYLTKPDPNKLASEIVKKIYSDHGIKATGASVPPTTKGKTGSYLADEYRRISSREKEFDLLVRLAGIEDKNIYLDGDTGYFIDYIPEKQLPILVTARDRQIISTFPKYDLIFSEADFEKQFGAADVKVEVRSWDQGKKKDGVIKETAGNGNFVRRIMLQGANRDKCRTVARATYEKIKQRILGGELRNIPMTPDLIEKNQMFNVFQFMVEVLNVGLGLSQYYFPIGCKHTITHSSWAMDLRLNNAPEGGSV
jgi:hypothetical protein